MVDSERYFSQVKVQGTPLWDLCAVPAPSVDLEHLLRILDFVHIEAGLLSAYNADYPLVESRELIPAFDAPLIEYKDLPAFSMVVLDRQLSYQDEGFQYDQLLPEGQPPDPGRAAANRAVLRERLPRNLLPELEQTMGRKALTVFSRYTQLLPLLSRMDRGHVLARDESGVFHLAGVFASFPSDLDGEIRRLGRSIGKFSQGDNARYAANRLFVYRFLMEQGGFPICGERHTSAALFARRLMRRRERFAVKVLGNSDRAITTLTSLGATTRLPRVSKVALVAAHCERKEGEQALADGGFFVDRPRKVVILKVRYQHHNYHPDNVLEDRALSVLSQTVIHPQTGQEVDLDVLGLNQDRLLMLQDIVRGEHLGTIVYRGRERVGGTGDTKSRLKFLSSWLNKHRLLLADYTPENFDRVLKVLASFLDDPNLDEEFSKNRELHQEVLKAMAELRLSHRLRLLEKLVQNRADASGRKLKHAHILIILVHVLSQEGEEMSQQHPRSLRKLLRICRKQLNDRELRRRLLNHSPRSAYDREVLGEYRLLERLVQKFEAVLIGQPLPAPPPAPGWEALAVQAPLAAGGKD
ncbi:MAG: hypothetical protein LDL11_04365 [Desulfarculus sp.]|nr:hypothetical protein [Desulfarculus sp.]